MTLVHAPGNVRTSYSWDDENRNTKLVIPGGAITTMAYRHDGLRVRKQTAAGTTKFICDGQNYLLETDASDTINRVLTNEPMGYGNLVSQRVKSGAVWTPYYHHFDALGSTRQMTGSAGSIVNSYAYTAWGEAISALTSESIANFFRWVGMLGYFFDDEADTYYVRARHYDPVTGRWLAQDPIAAASTPAESGPPRPSHPEGNVNDFNLYCYVGNNTLTKSDPSGLHTHDDCDRWYDQCGDVCRRMPNKTWRDRNRRRMCWAACFAEYATCISTCEETVKCVVVGGACVVGGALVLCDGPLPIGDACAAGIVGAVICAEGDSKGTY